MNLPLAVGVVVAVAALAWLLRRFAGGTSAPTLSGPLEGAREPAPTWSEPEPDEEPDEGPDEIAVIASDGTLFLPLGGGVELLAPASEEQAEQERATGAIARGRVIGMLAAGDLAGARLVRGAPGVDPWRLEGIGREREYLAWSFETESAARAALDLLERLVVRAPAGPEGDPEPPGPEAFEEARRVYDETARELAIAPEEPEEERG